MFELDWGIASVGSALLLIVLQNVEGFLILVARRLDITLLVFSYKVFLLYQ